MSSYDQDVENVRKKAEKQGWRYLRASNGHHQFYSPDKEHIVTASSTPSDHRSWDNFIAEMRRCGYDDSNGPIGLALEEVRAAAAAVAERKEETTASGLTRAFLRDNPNNVYNVDRIFMHVQAHKPGASRLAVQQALGYMASEGQITRVGRGEYRWTTEPVREKIITTAPAATESLSLIGQLGEFTGDPAIDADLAQLDEALAALGQIEDVVKRTREKIAMVYQLKKLLGG